MHGMNTNTKKCTENRNHVVNSLVHCPIHLLLSTGIIDDRNIPGKVLVSRDQVRMRLVFVFFYARTRICKIEILSSTHLFIVASIPSTSSCPPAPSTIGTSPKSRRRYRNRVRMWLVFVFFYARTRIRKIETLSSTHHCRIHLLSSISSCLNLSWTRHRIAPFGPIRGTTIRRQRDELLPKLCLPLNFN